MVERLKITDQQAREIVDKSYTSGDYVTVKQDAKKKKVWFSHLQMGIVVDIKQNVVITVLSKDFGWTPKKNPVTGTDVVLYESAGQIV